MEKKAKIGFYAGSFDPFTKGHLQIAKKACEIFDCLVIGIGTHPSKKRRFDKEKMKKAIKDIMIREGLGDKVYVTIYDGLTTDAASYWHADYLVRGIRNDMDYQYEESIASLNMEISGNELDTIYFRAGELGNVSSSMVMELLRNGKEVIKYVPKEVLALIEENES